MSYNEMREEKSGGLTRRAFMRSAAAAAGTIAVAQVAAKEARGAEATSAAAAAPAKPAALRMDDVLRTAREKLFPRCRVCPECDGNACAGEVPGM
ncbi:MAG TPA: alpha-hydroxy-acid oxidizing protein, partial [Thermodesulfobacteriota bacterium]|nr:alpha-hydroxy-acid oxidizing protein [Thermodesulfobacteriota bacterium]